MAAVLNNNKRARSIESVEMPGGFPDHRKPNKRRLDSYNGVIGSGGEWLLSCVTATFSYAKSWFSGAPAAAPKPEERAVPLVETSPLTHEYRQSSRLNKSNRLVEEYTTPSRPYYGASQLQRSTFSPSFSEGVSAWSQASEDAQSIISIDSTVPDHSEYDYLFGKPSGTPPRKFTFESSVASSKLSSPSPFSTETAGIRNQLVLPSAAVAAKKVPGDLWISQL
ncbi:hypothetical protein IWW57_000398, partial [Coemansia sp. S610]